MKIEFLGKEVSIGTKFKGIATKKIDKLNRYFGENATARIVCKQEGKRKKLELTVTNKGLLYRSEVVGDNIYENLDLALPKIERQIIKASAKKREFFNPDAFVIPDLLFIEEMPKEKAPELMKKKRFTLAPMSFEDAKYNLEALDHNFYIYLNQETGMVNVVYKRNDGDLGLIECDY